ncbi:hypothetical protein HDU82_006375, partial [Entophlyctis luteolus]
TSKLSSQRTSFTNLALHARAHFLLYRILHENGDHSKLALPSAIDSGKNHRQTLEDQETAYERKLYPWISPTHSSLAEMRHSLDPNSVGIVIACGNPHFYVTQHLIITLRTIFNVTLPIEVFYSGKHDLSSKRIKVLERLPGVEMRNLHNYFPRETKRVKAWSAKPYTILASRFSTVLFIDADVSFLKSPVEVLTNSERFKKYGILFYRDRKLWFPSGTLNGVRLLHKMNPHLSRNAMHGPYAQSIFPNVTGTTNEMESGFMAVDKSRSGVLFTLLFAAKLNGRRERQDFYKASHGDKEAFWFAAEVLRVPYEFNPSYAGTIGVLDQQSNGTHLRICGGQMLHLNEANEPFWIHGGGVLAQNFRTNRPPFRFVALEWMAFQHRFGINEQLWDERIDCMHQEVTQTAPVGPDLGALLDTHRHVYRTGIRDAP